MAPKEGTIEAVVESAVKAHVQKMIVESFESIDGLVGRIVAGAMQAKVKDGSSYRELPFIEKLCKDAIQDAAQTGVRDWIEENRPALMAEVKRQVTAQKGDIAASMVEAFIKGVSSTYSFKVLVGERGE